jgi:hypothetical protein
VITFEQINTEYLPPLLVFISPLLIFIFHVTEFTIDCSPSIREPTLTRPLNIKSFHSAFFTTHYDSNRDILYARCSARLFITQVLS